MYRSGPARLLLGEFCRANRYCAVLVGDTAASRPVAVGVLRHAELFGGVSSACRRRVGGLDGVSPSIAGDEVAAWGGAAPKSQTTSVTYVENGVLWARWSAIWAQQHPVWSVARMWAPEYMGCPLDTHINPLCRT